jgi:apolipoprotein N-acyltransferase
MRAANTGISAGFDARGHELGRLGIDETGSLTIALPGAEAITGYARFGLGVPVLLAVLILGSGFVGRRVTSQGCR